MTDIQMWKDKIKSEVKKSDYRSFIRSIASRYPVVLTKSDGMISCCAKTERMPRVVSQKEFEKSRDQLTKQGMVYDDSRSFFDNFQELFLQSPFPNIIHFTENENSEYAHCVLGSKNIYLGYAIIGDVENCCYGFSVKIGSRNVFNSVMVREHSENVYMSTGIISSYNIFYSKYITNSSNIRFSTNLTGCQECILCDGLDNQSYCIRNQKLDKETYFKEKENLLKNKDQFLERRKNLHPRGRNIGSENVQGDFIINSGNIDDGHLIYEINDAYNVLLSGGKEVGERIANAFGTTPPLTDGYGVVSVGAGSDNVYNSVHIVGSSNIYWSQLIDNCSYCIGCIGLKNKSFCILNKEYDKEERFEFANKIFESMDKDGTLGQFFPGWMNPFYFNDTAAYLIDDSFTKNEITAEGYLRRDEEIKVDIPQNADVVETRNLASYQGFENGERKINPDILKKVIKDEKGNYYRIVKMEYDFLVKHGLPLPELHWLDRIKLGFKFK